MQRSRDRRRFVAARGWLRHLLAGHLRCGPADVRIVAGEHGKPRLADCDLRFNAARSAGIALYATSWQMEVGVDIEAIRPIADLAGIASRFFSPAERRRLASLPPSKRRTAFFECWTHKEAYGKGLGVGLTVPLDAVDSWTGDGRLATASNWSVHPIDLTPGFAAAVGGPGLREGVPTPRRLGPATQ